jgi:hypothetical protein
MGRRVITYLFNLLIAVDQFFNALLGGNPDETISSRVGKKVTTSPFAFVVGGWINSIFFWQKDHVKESIEHDENDVD